MNWLKLITSLCCALLLDNETQKLYEAEIKDNNVTTTTPSY